MKFPKRIRIEHGDAGEAPKVFDADTDQELAVVTLQETTPAAWGGGVAATRATTVTVTFADEAGRPHRREFPETRVRRVRRDG
jgi:hypothetical protein